MDVSKSDVDFDSYWDEEARNPNRNRIRIGRQYQAQVPALLKPGESDGRKLEELETLSWNPHNPLTRVQLDQYFAIANSIGLFVQAIDTCQDGIEETDCLEEEKCIHRPFEILDIGTKNTLEAKSESSTSSNLTSPEKQSITTRQQRLQQQRPSSHHSSKEDVESSSSSTSPLKHSSNTKIQTAMKGLSAFLTSHHPVQHEKRCKFPASVCSEHPSINLGSSEKYNVKTLSKILMGEWSSTEAKIFAKAINMCGKNFSAIKKDYLPWKSVRSIIEFYYLTLDKEKELNKQKKNSSKVGNKYFDKPNKSPVDENKRRKGSKDSSESKTTNATENQETSESNDNASGDSNLTRDSKNDNSSNNSCEKDHESAKEDGAFNSSLASLVKSASNCSNVTNGSLSTDALMTSKPTSGNMNGNSSITTSTTLFPEFKKTILPGQEVKPTKAKPIHQIASLMEGSDALNGSNTNLGSLNLYLHGELVLKLNAQQQESGQKWVESMEALPKKKRSSSSSNGLSNSVSARSLGAKRSLDFKSGNFFKEEPDDISVGGGDGSASDDDSITSNESSSLMASSPSSSSTITSAAKKARVKVENLSSLSMNGNPVPSPNSNSRRSDSQANNSGNKHRTMSPSVMDNEIDLKRILEANLSLFRPDNGHLQMLFNNSLGGGLGTLFDPPKAHSNSSIYSPTKSSMPKPDRVPPAANNGHQVNGLVPGPVDLTRKSPSNGHSGERTKSPASLLSPSRSKTSHQLSVSTFSPSSKPKAAHEATHSSSLSPHRFASNSLGLFSLPAPPPPPPNVPVSPNSGSKSLKKPLIRTGGVQYAK